MTKDCEQGHVSSLDLDPEQGLALGRYYSVTPEGRVRCELCPRMCTLSDQQRGFCFIRQARGQKLVLTSYGRASGFCVDPIEKKPLNHFFPGTSVLSFGTAGCNLGCRFCQNWDISKAREMERLNDRAGPQDIAEAAHRAGCKSVAFTYNDPVIFAEYAIDTAKACHDKGIKTVAVTAGYISPKAREEFFSVMDAANVDLKAFSERFYHKLCFASLAPVLETLEYLVKETGVWVEVTTLLIPGENDSDSEIGELCDWMASHLGPDVPLHFTAFHPDFKLTATPWTPADTLFKARNRALAAGIRHVYTGNIRDHAGQSTYCPQCGIAVIERAGYDIGEYKLGADGLCTGCGARIAGRFGADKGRWGSRRMPVRLV